MMIIGTSLFVFCLINIGATGFSQYDYNYYGSGDSNPSGTADYTSDTDCTNACPNVVCSNGGTLYEKIDETTGRCLCWCKCTAIWTGETCEQGLPALCTDQPCENGGYCSADRDSDAAVCHCSRGYIGSHCTSEVPTAVLPVDIQSLEPWNHADEICQSCNGSTFILNKFTMSKLVNIGDVEQVWLGGVMVLSDWIDFVGCVSNTFIDEFITQSMSFQQNSPSLCQQFCKTTYFGLHDLLCVCLSSGDVCDKRCDKDIFCGGTSYFRLYRTLPPKTKIENKYLNCTSIDCYCDENECKFTWELIRLAQRICKLDDQITCGEARKKDELLNGLRECSTSEQKFMIRIHLNRCGWSSPFRDFAQIKSEFIDYDKDRVTAYHIGKLKNGNVIDAIWANYSNVQSLLCEIGCNDTVAADCLLRTLGGTTDPERRFTTISEKKDVSKTLSNQNTATVKIPFLTTLNNTKPLALHIQTIRSKIGIIIGVTCTFVLLVLTVTLFILFRKGKLKSVKKRLSHNREGNIDSINTILKTVNNQERGYDLAYSLEENREYAEIKTGNAVSYEMPKPFDTVEQYELIRSLEGKQSFDYEMARPFDTSEGSNMRSNNENTGQYFILEKHESKKTDDESTGQYSILEKQSKDELAKIDQDTDYATTMEGEYDHLHERRKRHANINDSTTYAHTITGTPEDTYDTTCTMGETKNDETDTYNHVYGNPSKENDTYMIL